MSHPMMMMIMRQLIFQRSFSTFIFYVFVKQSQIMDFDDLKFQWNLSGPIFSQPVLLNSVALMNQKSSFFLADMTFINLLS